MNRKNFNRYTNYSPNYFDRYQEEQADSTNYDKRYLNNAVFDFREEAQVKNKETSNSRIIQKNIDLQRTDRKYKKILFLTF